MNCLLHIHVAAERGLILLCHRKSEEPATLYVDRIIVDGVKIKEEDISLILGNYQSMIYAEMSRKLNIRKASLSLLKS
jgi:hypothetical protein